MHPCIVWLGVANAASEQGGCLNSTHFVQFVYGFPFIWVCLQLPTVAPLGVRASFGMRSLCLVALDPVFRVPLLDTLNTNFSPSPMSVHMPARLAQITRLCINTWYRLIA